MSRTGALPGRATVVAYGMVLAAQVAVVCFALAYGVLRANGAWV